MIAIQDFGFRRWEPGAATVVQMLIEPAVAIGTLLAAAACFGVPFAGSYVILALLVFALTFPGEPPSSRVPFLRVVLPRWGMTGALLLLLGWGAGALPALDDRVLIAWALATPWLLFAAHRVCPILLTQFCAVKSVQWEAQVKGLRGETDTVEKMQARIECDLDYLRRWSPLFDLSIALKTISAILSRKNAY
jgi:hypothetical protein